MGTIASVDEASSSLINWLQETVPWLLPVAEILTFLGDEGFYVLVIPLLYWAVSPRVGLRLGAVLLVSAGLNATLKLAFAAPRPFWVSDAVEAHVIETSFGIPSGHAQNAVVVWGVLANELRRRWVWAAAATLVMGIGLSRWLLGVHAVEDTLVGWMVGGLLLGAYIVVEPRASAFLSRASLPTQIAAAVTAPLVLVAGAVAAVAARPAWAPPPLWTDNVAATAPGTDLAPMSLASVLTAAGALCGLGLGVILLHRLVPSGFTPHPVLWRRVVASLVGLVGVLVLWMGLGLVVPSSDDLVAAILRFVRYTAVGAWVAGVAPVALLWMRLGVHSRQPTTAGRRPASPK